MKKFWGRAEDGRNRELTIVHTLSLALSRTHDPIETLAKGLEHVLQLLDLQAGATHEALWDQGRLKLRVSQGLPSSFLAAIEEIPMDGTYAGEAVREGRTVAVRDLAAAAPHPSPLREVVEQEGYRGLACVPIFVEERVWGILTVFGKEPRALSPEQVRVLEAVSSQFGIALERALLISEMARSNTQLRALLEAAEAGKRSLETVTRVARSVTTTLNLAEVFRAVVQAVVDLFPGNMCSLWVADGESLKLRAEAGTLAPRYPKTIFRFGEGLVGVVAATCEPLIVADVQLDGRVVNREWIEREGFVSYLGLPLIAGDRVQGVLELLMRTAHHFLPEEVALLESFASQAVVAIDNARLFQETIKHAARVEALVQLNQAMSASLRPDRVLETVRHAAVRLFNAFRVAVWIADDDRQVLTLWMPTPRDPLDQVRPQRHFGDGGVGWVAEHREPILFASIEIDERLSPPDRVHNQGCSSFTAIPIQLESRLLGVLSFTTTESREVSAENRALFGFLAGQAAVALENARLYEEAQKRARELQGLIRAGRVVSSSLEEREVLETIVQEAAAVMRVGSCSLRLLDPTGEHLIWAADVGIPAEWREETPRPLGEGLAGWVAAEGRPLAVLDPLTDPRTRHRDVWEKFGLASYLGAPVKEGDRTIGVLSFYTREPRQFSEDEVALALSFADQAAIAIKNVRLFEAAVSRTRELSALYSVASAAGQSLNLGEILERALERAIEVLEAEAGIIFLVEGEELRPATFRGIPEESVPMFSHRKIGEGLAWKTIQRGEPIWFEDVAADPEYLRLATRGMIRALGFRALVLVPILSGTPIGVLVLVHRAAHRFSPEEVQLLIAIAQQLAVAINNARLFQETQQAYEELAATQEELVRVEKLRAMGEMASGVAHDFNNVLAAILGRTQLLLQRIEDPEIRRWLAVIEQAAIDGAQTVRRIQEFTRVRREQSFTAVDIVQLIRDALEVTQLRWRDEPQSQGFVVRVETELIPVPPIPGDPAELREVLTNLILNALDAMPTGGTLTLTNRGDERGVTIEVTDTGLGMSDEVRRRVFDPFFTTKGPQGTGLGLAVAYGIITRHGGGIQVESREGVGSTFTICLPYGPLEPPPVPSRESVQVAGARVLVIDDEASVREALRDILSLRHVVDEAASGEEGIERFKQEEFDLVFTDLGMAGMTGWQVAQAIKALRPSTPVILVTGWGVQLDPVELRTQGVERVLSKPFSITEVLDLVASLVTTGGDGGGEGKRRKGE